MTPTILFTLGTAPAGWLPVAQDLLRRAPQGVELMLRGVSEWHHAVELSAGQTSGAGLAAWADALPAEDPLRGELAEVGGDRRAAWGALEPRACWTLPVLAEAYPGACYLVLVEAPAQALAAELLVDDACQATEVLDRWVASARRILRHLHAHPGRCLVLDAAEARQDRALATLLCRERTGIALREPAEDAPALGGPDPLALYLADAMASRHPASAAAYAELQAACQPLTDELAAPRARPDIHTAAVQLRVLEAARKAVDRMSADLLATQLVAQQAGVERDAACADATEVLARQHRQQEQLAAALLQQQATETKVASLEAELAGLQHDLAQTKASLAGSRKEARELTTEVEASRRDMQAAAANEEALRDKLLAAEVSRETAHRHRDELAQQLESMAATVTELRAEMQRQSNTHAAAMQEQLAASSLQQQTAQAGLAALEAERETAHQHRAELAQQLLRANEEKRLLIARLHDAHGEVAQVQQQLRRLDERLPHAAAARGAGLDLGQVRTGSARNTPPHRELEFDFPSLRRPGRPVQALSLRLVEHNGNPGLVLFDDGTPPLDGWQESGREGERPLTLLVPADHDSRRRLAGLGASDWLLLQAVMSGLERALRAGNDGLPGTWLLVLQRLRAQIDALPPQPRHDRVEFATVEGEGGRVGLHVLMHVVDCAGTRQLRWGLTWWPAADGGDVEWQTGPRGCVEPPLLSWPVDAQTGPVERLRLAASTHLPRAARRARWLALPPQDLQLMRAVNAAVPAWLEAAAAAGSVTAQQQAAWRAWAQVLAGRIDAELRPPLLRRALRALAASLRGAKP